MHIHYTVDMTTNVQIRIDTKLKKESEKLLNKLGLDFPTAFRIFLIKMNMVQGIPFSIADDTDRWYYSYSKKEEEEILCAEKDDTQSPIFTNAKNAIAYLKKKK
jgi:addiction module RelB/DinJ family antitoxin